MCGCVCGCVRTSQLQLERDELYKTYIENIEKARNKAGLKTTLLERQLEALTDSVASKEAQLQAVLSASNMDWTALSGVISKTGVLFYMVCFCFQPSFILLLSFKVCEMLCKVTFMFYMFLGKS